MKLINLLFLLVLGQYAAAQEGITIYNIKPGNYGSSPMMFTEFKGKLYFMADDSAHGYELWCIDKGTMPKMVYDLNPGAVSGGLVAVPPYPSTYLTSGIRHMAVLLDDSGKHKTLYFPGNNGSTGWELFKYDTFSASPVVAYEFKPGMAALRVNDLFNESVSVNGKVFFPAQVGSQCYLYQYDPGANLAKAIDSTSTNNIINLTVYKNKLYYNIADTFCSYNTVSNTKTLISYSASSTVYGIDYIHVIGDKLYFGTGSIPGNLYEYDGINTPKNIAGYCGGATAVKSWPIGTNNGKIYFPCADSKGICQPCEYDPLTKKTKLLGGLGSKPHSFVSCMGQLYFAAYDSVHDNELWTYDGVNPPYMVVDIDTVAIGYSPMYLTSFEGDIYFAGEHYPEGYELMKYTPSTTSVSNIMFNGEVIVYPNPATERCTVELNLDKEAGITITLYDITGKVLHIMPVHSYPAGKSLVDIPMQGVKSGIYFVQLRGSNGTLLYVSKVIKQ